jgi:alginate O-acetyltransferase complex protein AlgI
MNFATKAFMIFLPCVLLIYHSLPTRRLKFTFLLLASWGFYASWNPWYLWVILFTTTVDYTAGRLIAVARTPAGKRGWLVASLLANLGLLAYFKYTLFAVQNGIWLAEMLGYSATAPDWALRIILPLGISFHTFQGISYTIDVYRGKLPAVRSYRDFALFVAFFPQLVAGPIVRASEFLPQLVQPPRVSAAQVQAGLQLCIYGLFKKVFIADRLGQDFVDVVFARPGRLRPGHARAGDAGVHGPDLLRLLRLQRPGGWLCQVLRL